MTVKDINIKNHTYYFFNSIINIKDFDPDNIRIGEKSYKNIFIYYNGYVTIKKYLKMYKLNILHLIFGKMNGCFEEINGNKYLTLLYTDETKEKTKNMKDYGVKSKI